MNRNPNLFANKYRTKSTRLPQWDYSTPWWYFVTICVKDGVCRFGNVVDGEMRLSKVGEIVANEWQKTEQIRENVELDEWIVMPNHLHGIVIINRRLPVETHCNASLRKSDSGPANKFGPQSNNLAAIIRGFKGASTNRIHTTGHKNFAWQPRFYDHIIRNEKSLDKIRFYIHHNTRKWEEDEYHPHKLSVK